MSGDPLIIGDERGLLLSLRGRKKASLDSILFFFTSLKLSIAITENTIYQTRKPCHRQKGGKEGCTNTTARNIIQATDLVVVALLC